MHIASANPLALSEADIPADRVEREKSVLLDQIKEDPKAAGKPQQVLDKMLEGRMRKFFEESVLVKQAFVMNPDETVEAAVKGAEKEVGAPIAIKGFIRFASAKAWRSAAMISLPKWRRCRATRPSLFLALAPVEQGSEEWRGSGRSISGFHLRDALVDLDRLHPGLLTRYGGHAMAAGLTTAAPQLSRLGHAFESVAATLLTEEQLTRTIWTDGPLAPAEFTIDLARAIEAAGPFGQAFPEPLFDNEFVVLNRRVLKEKHLKLRLHAGQSTPVDAIWFSAPPELLNDTPPRLAAAVPAGGGALAGPGKRERGYRNKTV